MIRCFVFATSLDCVDYVGQQVEDPLETPRQSPVDVERIPLVPGGHPRLFLPTKITSVCSHSRTPGFLNRYLHSSFFGFKFINY